MTDRNAPEKKDLLVQIIGEHLRQVKPHPKQGQTASHGMAFPTADSSPFVYFREDFAGSSSRPL